MESKKFDVFIAGAGIAACTFARILVKGGMRVAMADIGNQFGNKAGMNLNNDPLYQNDVNQFGHIVRGLMHPVSIPPQFSGTKNALNPRQDPGKNLPGAVVAYALGGMAIHWTCAIPRFNKTVEEIKLIPSQEWDRLYPEAESYLNKHTDVFESSLRHNVIKNILNKTGKWNVQSTPLGAERISPNYVKFTGADTVLDALTATETDNLTVLPGHCATSITYKSGKVSSIIVRTLVPPEGEIEIFADYFVVASGWLHTPQILWNSNIRPKALGCYLSDHTFTACRILLRNEILEEIRSEAEKAGTPVSSDPLPVPMNDPKPHLYIPISENHLWHSQIFQEAFQFDALPASVDSRLVVDLKWFGMIDPVEQNKVMFTSEIRDKNKMPQATFDFQLGADDKKRLYEMMSDMQVVARILGDYLPGYEPKYIPLGASTHTMGTTRMGASDDGTSVTDSYSKVWGFDNLYLGGNCLIPVRTASNPTLTTVALAIRAAEQLLSNNNPKNSNKKV